jgi:hypothetical protein
VPTDPATSPNAGSGVFACVPPDAARGSRLTVITS